MRTTDKDSQKGGELTIENNIDTSTEESTEIVDQPEVEVDSSDQEPVITDNSQSESVQKDESFFDPNQVPEELKPAYKQMQAAFTKKTQEIAEARKASEELSHKATEYDKVSKYIPVLEEMMASKTQNQESPEMVALTQRLKAAGYGDDAIEMMKLGAQFTLDQFNRFQTEQSVNQQTQFVESKLTEAGKLDPRLNDQNLVYQTDDGESITFGQMVEQLVVANQDWVKDPVLATQKAIKRVDALIGKAKIEGKQELSAKAKTQAAKFPQTNSSSQGAVDKNQPLSFQEAYEQAKQEIGN